MSETRLSRLYQVGQGGHGSLRQSWRGGDAPCATRAVPSPPDAPLSRNCERKQRRPHSDYRPAAAVKPAAPGMSTAYIHAEGHAPCQKKYTLQKSLNPCHAPRAAAPRIAPPRLWYTGHPSLPPAAARRARLRRAGGGEGRPRGGAAPRHRRTPCTRHGRRARGKHASPSRRAQHDPPRLPCPPPAPKKR